MTQYGATMFVTKEMLDQARFDIREYVVEELRDQLEEATRGQAIIPNSWRLESQPFRDEHDEKARGARRLLERLRILKPRVVVIEGEQFRASIRTWATDIT